MHYTILEVYFKVFHKIFVRIQLVKVTIGGLAINFNFKEDDNFKLLEASCSLPFLRAGQRRELSWSTATLFPFFFFLFYLLI